MSVFDRLGERDPGYKPRRQKKSGRAEEADEEPESEMAIELRKNSKSVTEGDDTVVSLYDTEVPSHVCHPHSRRSGFPPSASARAAPAMRSSCASASSTSR